MTRGVLFGKGNSSGGKSNESGLGMVIIFAIVLLIIISVIASIMIALAIGYIWNRTEFKIGKFEKSFIVIIGALIAGTINALFCFYALGFLFSGSPGIAGILGFIASAILLWIVVKIRPSSSSLEIEGQLINPSEIKKATDLHLNLLCLVGAILGLCSLFVPWLYQHGPNGTISLNAFYLVGAQVPVEISLAMAMMIISVLMAFITPAAFSIQGISALLWISVTYSRWGGPPHDIMALPGIYLFMISGAIVAISFFLPIGIGLKGKPISFWSRGAIMDLTFF